MKLTFQDLQEILIVESCRGGSYTLLVWSIFFHTTIGYLTDLSQTSIPTNFIRPIPPPRSLQPAIGGMAQQVHMAPRQQTVILQ